MYYFLLDENDGDDDDDTDDNDNIYVCMYINIYKYISEVNELVFFLSSAFYQHLSVYHVYIVSFPPIDSKIM